MSIHPFTTFSKHNRRMIAQLVAGHLLWCVAALALWAAGGRFETTLTWWTGAFLAVQLFAAAQLLLPALTLQPEERSRSFYLAWGALLTLAIWLLNQMSATGPWLQVLAALRSALLLLSATLAGAVLARYVRRLWEIVPVCLVITLADIASWRHGPTAGFAQTIEAYYRAPEGPPPLIDMALVKLALPGGSTLMPVFGVSDWIMVAFFAAVARCHGLNDNLLGCFDGEPGRCQLFGRYLPVSVVALFGALALAQASGRLIPALPVVALAMLLWYAATGVKHRAC